MLGRCLNPKAHNWKWYGARGITVCERWRGKDGFNRFFEDMGEPEPGMTLDRINNEGHYEPGNCKWSTMKEQAANRRKAGPSPDPGSLRQKALTAGLPYSCVYQRMRFFGWTEHEALSTPKR
jgi:hypothetical protein